MRATSELETGVLRELKRQRDADLKNYRRNSHLQIDALSLQFGTTESDTVEVVDRLIRARQLAEDDPPRIGTDEARYVRITGPGVDRLDREDGLLTSDSGSGVTITGGNFGQFFVNSDVSMGAVSNTVGAMAASDPDLSKQLNKFLEQLVTDEDLSERQKRAVRAAVNDLASEINAEPSKRDSSRVYNAYMAVTQLIIASAALIPIWDATKPFVQHIFPGLNLP